MTYTTIRIHMLYRKKKLVQILQITYTSSNDFARVKENEIIKER